MKYLVLGSSGQIGFPLTIFLRKNGHEVLEFDLIEDNLNDLRIHNNILLEKNIKECDFVFFLAFDVGGSRYLAKYQHTYDFLHNNILLMSNTFDLLKKYNKPFIFASSQMSNMSYSPYGVAKAVGERYTAALNGVTVKFWNVYGPEKDLEKSHVITDFILKAKKDKKITMLTDGTESRQFLHADDCSECLIELSKLYDDLNRDKEYHITNFEWNTVLDVAKEIALNFDDVEIVPAESKDMVQKDKRNEPDPYILNFWKPKISLKEGIKKVIMEMK
jgi:nucleoside-diphosphate-sugar epimerase